MANTIRKTTDEFIHDSKKIHGDKFTYDKSRYVRFDHKLIITCQKHGDFMLSPRSHLAGAGCYKCNFNKSTTEEFIKSANKIHNNRYDYSFVNYVSVDAKVTIVCKIHGAFDQSPYNHLHGANCQKCVGTAKLTTNDFIRRAREKHGNKYDYSLSEYTGCKEKIVIICKIHGNFKQSAQDHIVGKECKLCALEKLNGIPITSPQVYEKFKIYKRLAYRLTNIEYEKYKNIINPGNLPRGQKDYHIDHIYSLKSGFINKVPLHIISSYINLQMILSIDNSIKGQNNGILLDDLYYRFNKLNE
jgi:hypothetical protein